MNKSLVTIYKNNTLITDSLTIAETFQKNHKDILKSINNLECSEEFRQRNFAPSSYKSIQNKELPKYLITQDGFTMLVMGYTGSEAMKFKEMYINEFNRMRIELENRDKPAIPRSFAEALQLAADLQRETERLAIENTEKQLKLMHQEPMVDSFRKWLDADGCMHIGTFGKMIGIGRNKLFLSLREMGILMNNNQPYQRYMKYFKIVDRVKEQGRSLKSYPTTLLNHEGCHYVKEKLKEAGHI